MIEVTDDPRIAGTRNETRDCLCIFRRYLKVVAHRHGENRDGNPPEDRHWVIVKKLAEPPGVHLLALNSYHVRGGRSNSRKLFALTLERVYMDQLEQRFRPLGKRRDDRPCLPEQDFLSDAS